MPLRLDGAPVPAVLLTLPLALIPAFGVPAFLDPAPDRLAAAAVADLTAGSPGRSRGAGPARRFC